RAGSCYEPGVLHDDLLVGVVASSAGAADRRCVPAAAVIFSLARRDSFRASIAIVDSFRWWRRTRGGWLVDVVFGSDAGRQRRAISPGVSSDAGHDDL